MLIFANIFLAFWWCTCTGLRQRPLPPWRSHFLNLIHYDYKNNSPNCLVAIFCWLHPFLGKASSSVVHLILIELELSFFTNLESIFGGWFCGWKRWPAAGHNRGRVIGRFYGCDPPKEGQLASLQKLTWPCVSDMSSEPKLATFFFFFTETMEKLNNMFSFFLSFILY